MVDVGRGRARRGGEGKEGKDAGPKDDGDVWKLYYLRKYGDIRMYASGFSTEL